MHWVEMLPDTQTPSWLGLPSNAEKVLLTTQGMPQPVISIISLCSVILLLRPSFKASCSHIDHLFLYSSVFTVILTDCHCNQTSRSCVCGDKQ